jgi:hypothetical protein
MEEPQQMDVEQEIRALTLANRKFLFLQLLASGLFVMCSDIYSLEYSVFLSLAFLVFFFYFSVKLASGLHHFAVQALKQEKIEHKNRAKAVARQLKTLAKKKSKLMKALFP